MSTRPRMRLTPRTPRSIVEYYSLDEINESLMPLIMKNITDKRTLNVPMTQIFVSKIDNHNLDFISTTGLSGCLTIIISSSSTFLFTHVQSDLIKTTMSELQQIKKVYFLFIQLMLVFNSKSEKIYKDINDFFEDKDLKITLVTASFNDLLFKMTYNYLMPKEITFTQIQNNSIFYNFKNHEYIDPFFKLNIKIYKDIQLEAIENITEYSLISEDESSITDEEAQEIIEKLKSLPRTVLKQVLNSSKIYVKGLKKKE